MSKLKSTFNSKIDSINITPNFSDIKGKINYKASLNVNIKKNNYNIYKFCISSLSLVVSCVFICLVILKTDGSSFDKRLLQDLKNTEMKLESKNQRVRVSDENIYISYPMVACGCNLEEELEFTSSNWEVYKDGKIQDKNNLNLEYGHNNYEIILYKLNEVEKDYNLEITVGE